MGKRNVVSFIQHSRAIEGKGEEFYNMFIVVALREIHRRSYCRYVKPTDSFEIVLSKRFHLDRTRHLKLNRDPPTSMHGASMRFSKEESTHWLGTYPIPSFHV